MKLFPKFSIPFTPRKGPWLLGLMAAMAGTQWLAAAGAEFPSGVEGTVADVRPGSNGGLRLTITSGTNSIVVNVLRGDGSAPALFSRIRLDGNDADRGGQSAVSISGLDRVEFLSGETVPFATDVAGLHRLGAARQHQQCVARLSGLVLGASPGGNAFALQDASGVALFEMSTPGTAVSAGQEILVEGNAVVEGDRVQFVNAPVVSNDDIHNMTEQSGPIFLTAGKHPLRLAWFNLALPSGLEVHVEGPDLPRRRIPDSALFRRQTGDPGGRTDWVNGLDFICCEGSWLRVPDFNRLTPVKRGSAANFDLGVVTRTNDVGLQFTGWFDAPRDGIYRFTTISDDGSLLFLDERPPSIEVTGTKALPEPVQIAARESPHSDENDRWAQISGKVTFVSERAGTLELELSSDTGRMSVELADDSGAEPRFLLNSRVRVTGICLAARDPNPAARLLAPGIEQIELLAIPAEHWAEHARTPVGSLAAGGFQPDANAIVHMTGRIESRSDTGFILRDESGAVQVTTARATPSPDGTRIELLGSAIRRDSQLLVQCLFYRESTAPTSEVSTALPVLTTAEQIKRLNREEWQRGYPVSLRGVVTTILDGGFFIQDSTGSIYARWRAPTSDDVPRIGDFWQIEGKTFAEFAPNIQVSRATRLGRGVMPEPLHPTWDQLINGSLDTEYIEVQGIITAVESDEATLLTRSGKIRLQLPDLESPALRRNVDALVRVRGCVMPVRDVRTQQVAPGQMRLANASINVDEPPPSDPFALPLKHAPDLLLFDPGASAFRRVRIAGQIVHEGDGKIFLMDGGNGLRIAAKSTAGLQVGDLVETVGFPDLGGPSPVLREAVVHRLKNVPLPEPVVLPANPPLDWRYDGVLVRIQARISDVNSDHSGEVFELQSGTRGFVARLKLGNFAPPPLQSGSLLELTGVYAGQGTDIASGRQINSFELLLNSPADIRVLARPSWWTVGHTLMVVGGMAFVILAALFWIALLRRQVEERSQALAVEIRRHEHTERQRELEAERSRIARDLHDDLGASLTQIRFLSALESRDLQLPEGSRGRIGQISRKCHAMVASLDEIVWAVNPANDSLPMLANYLCHFAEEFFQPTAIRCRLDVDDALPDAPLTSEVRHDLYLAVREALNNIARHSGATEAWLRIHAEASTARLIVEDNGTGFPAGGADHSGNGLDNMRQRMQKIGGSFECENRPGRGVACRFSLPLKIASSDSGNGSV